LPIQIIIVLCGAHLAELRSVIKGFNPFINIKEAAKSLASYKISKAPVFYAAHIIIKGAIFFLAL
jgi:hypothetical protein